MPKQLPLFEAPTDKQRQAIAILQSNPGLEPLAFARLMWPDSKGWGKSGNFYWGGMSKVAMGMLGSLRQAGYAFVQNDKWYAAVNIDFVTLAITSDPQTPF